MKTDMVRYSHQKFNDLSELQWERSKSAQVDEWFDRLVVRQHPFSRDPSEVAKYFGVAEDVNSLQKIGFCFAHSNLSIATTELAGLFVVADKRNLGVATQLLMEAISTFYVQLDARVFNLRFIEESARCSRLAEELRSFAGLSFPGAVFNLFFPEDPRHECIGA